MSNHKHLPTAGEEGRRGPNIAVQSFVLRVRKRLRSALRSKHGPNSHILGASDTPESPGLLTCHNPLPSPDD
jgi:hypothetical protein